MLAPQALQLAAACAAFSAPSQIAEPQLAAERSGEFALQDVLAAGGTPASPIHRHAVRTVAVAVASAFVGTPSRLHWQPPHAARTAAPHRPVSDRQLLLCRINQGRAPGYPGGMQTPRSTRAIPAAEWAVASSHGFATTRMDFGGHHRYPSSPSTARRHAPMAARLGSPSSPRSHHNVQLVPLGATQQYARSNPVVSGPAASKQARVSYDIFGTRSVAPPAPFERAISTPGRQAIRHNNLGAAHKRPRATPAYPAGVPELCLHTCQSSAGVSGLLVR
jgi:hypothetical protein